MQEIRLHGRGGQGAVTSAELVAIAAINKGQCAQAFPSFGPERRGAPVVAFSRIDDKKINIRAKIYNPDVVIVLDPGLLALMNPTEGMKADGILILNTKKSPEEIRKTYGYKCKIATVDASKIAIEEVGRPIVNTTLLGSFIKATGILKMEDITEPIMNRFGPKLGAKNMAALKRAFEETIVKEFSCGKTH
jgi:pyruvate ferredoxin oxidoreductase gamma subunit